jgi:hypothetical protein
MQTTVEISVLHWTWNRDDILKQKICFTRSWSTAQLMFRFNSSKLRWAKVVQFQLHTHTVATKWTQNATILARSVAYSFRGCRLGRRTRRDEIRPVVDDARFMEKMQSIPFCNIFLLRPITLWRHVACEVSVQSHYTSCTNYYMFRPSSDMYNFTYIRLFAWRARPPASVNVYRIGVFISCNVSCV